jgi:hypothetical protein
MTPDPQCIWFFTAASTLTLEAATKKRKTDFFENLYKNK